MMGRRSIRPWRAFLQAAHSGKGSVLWEKETRYSGLGHFTGRYRNPRKVRLLMSSNISGGKVGNCRETEDWRWDWKVEGDRRGCDSMPPARSDGESGVLSSEWGVVSSMLRKWSGGSWSQGPGEQLGRPALPKCQLLLGPVNFILLETLDVGIFQKLRLVEYSWVIGRFLTCVNDWRQLW